jgi:DNA repair exonuclease SbcCD nuclease subunit
MLKFIHISDTHLGFSDLDILDDEGKNIREEDVYRAFETAVDIIIEEKPDFVIHSGDIFHRSSPSNRALVIAAQQISRMTDAGISFYMIAGNHDYPKSIFTSPIHNLYENDDLIKIVYDEQLEIIERDDCVLHLLPHINSEQRFLEEVEKIKIVDRSKPNILAMHLAVSNYVMNEFGERVFPLENASLLREFDYVALGHWHRYNHLQKYGNVYYSGSTERTSDTQTGYDKGIIKVTVDDEVKADFIPLDLRIYEKIKILDCHKKSPEKIIGELKAGIENVKIDGGIFHIQLIDLPAEKVHDIPRSLFEDMLDTALFFNVTKTIKGSDQKIEIDSDRFDLKEYFIDSLKESFEGENLKKLTKLSQKLWDEIEEEEAVADS